MGATGDVRGYYAVLGLAPGATITEVKEAFRRLAKDCHPDRTHVTDGGARFRQISEAYETLSAVELKAAYDRGTINSPPPPEEPAAPQSIDPIACDVCGKVTAQPRRLAFWRVTSFVLASQKTPVQKVYCRSCATKEQWKSTIWTSLLGWWGIPWGPVWSISQGVTNALGGSRDAKVDEALMWQNALAFATNGQGELAVGLGNILRKSEDADLAHRSAELIRFFSDRGVAVSTTFKDVWKRSIPQTLALLITAFALPGAALAFASLEPSSGIQSIGPTSAESMSTDQPLQDVFGANEVAANATPEQATRETAVPTCKSPPSSGKVFTDKRGTIAEGHVLKIDNGTEGDAIVKLRDAATDKTVASFFVKSGQAASLNRIPDGTFRIQYAFGRELRPDCRSFVQLASAGEFPEAETLVTKYREELDGTYVVHGRLSYTLYGVPGGNVSPDHISAADFNRP